MDAPVVDLKCDSVNISITEDYVVNSSYKNDIIITENDDHFTNENFSKKDGDHVISSSNELGNNITSNMTTFGKNEISLDTIHNTIYPLNATLPYVNTNEVMDSEKNEKMKSVLGELKDIEEHINDEVNNAKKKGKTKPVDGEIVGTKKVERAVIPIDHGSISQPIVDYAFNSQPEPIEWSSRKGNTEYRQ